MGGAVHRSTTAQVESSQLLVGSEVVIAEQPGGVLADVEPQAGAHDKRESVLEVIHRSTLIRHITQRHSQLRPDIPLDFLSQWNCQHRSGAKARAEPVISVGRGIVEIERPVESEHPLLRMAVHHLKEASVAQAQRTADIGFENTKRHTGVSLIQFPQLLLHPMDFADAQFKLDCAVQLVPVRKHIVGDHLMRAALNPGEVAG